MRQRVRHQAGWLPGLIAFGLWLGAIPLAAQQPAIGSELRLWRCPTARASGAQCDSAYESVRGRLARVDPDSLYLADPPRAIGFDALGLVELAVGRRSHTLLGAAIGGAAGTVAGGLVTAAVCASDGCGEVTLAPVLFVGGGLVGGALVGGVVGALWRSTRWRPVSIAGLRVTMTVRPGGGRAFW